MRQVVGRPRPACRFFQEGRCANPACTFRHVHLADARPRGSGPERRCGSPASAQAASRRVVAGSAPPDATVELEAGAAPPEPPPRPPAAALARVPAPSMGMAPIVALAGLDVASAAMAHIAGRSVLQPRASARGSAAGPNAQPEAGGAPAAPCRFFCRTGACERGAGCKYAHDADRMALCRAFLAGKCAAREGAGRGRAAGAGGVCLLSHDATPERTPACSFFLRGLCADPQCVYVHVAVSRSAPPCADFALGYCSRGLSCVNQHLFACEDWASSGSCPRADGCPLRRTHTAPAVGAKRARHQRDAPAAAEGARSPSPSGQGDEY